MDFNNNFLTAMSAVQMQNVLVSVEWACIFLKACLNITNKDHFRLFVFAITTKWHGTSLLNENQVLLIGRYTSRSLIAEYACFLYDYFDSRPCLCHH